MAPQPDESPKPRHSITETHAGLIVTVECTGGIEIDLPARKVSHRYPLGPPLKKNPTLEDIAGVTITIDVTEELVFRPRPKSPAAPPTSSDKPGEGDKPAE
jgi:hypothetical protein